MTTRDLIEQGLAIASRATPGEWRHVPEDNVIVADKARRLIDVVCRSDEVGIAERDANAALIAFAGTHLKTILEALQSAEAERTALLSRLDALAGEWRNRDDGMYGQVWSEAAAELRKLK